MSDFRKLINIASAYSKVAEPVNEDFTSWLKDKLGINDKIAKQIGIEAEKQGADITTTPTSTGPVAPPRPDGSASPISNKPANNTAPKTPGAETPGMAIDGDVTPTQPQPAFTDELPKVDKTTPTPPAGAGAGRGDGQAELDQRRKDANAAGASASPTVAPGTGADGPAGGAKAPTETPPAAAKPPVRPGQATSGLPAKLGQVTSKNLMKDYQTGGKKPMDQVKTIQLALSRLGFDPNGIDGKYGNGVFKAVQDFQKANGLTVDGQVGPNTIKAMQAKLNADAAPATGTAATGTAATGTAAPAAADQPAADQPAGNNPDEADPTVGFATQPAGNNPDEADPNAGGRQQAAPKIKNPYTGADADKFSKLSPEDQEWLTRGGKKPDINDQFILRRAPNGGKLALNMTGPKPTTQNASKDHSMKKAMNESASMNVSMTADTADQVAELMKLLKNAGMSDAAPVSSMMAPMPTMPPMGAAAPKQDSMADFIGMVGGDEMDGPSEPCSVCGEVHEETSCSEDTSEYDAVVAEWDNSPDEEYKDANYMLNDLAGGLNRPKKAYAAAQDGDNAMAVEAIKADLRKALEEALVKK